MTGPQPTVPLGFSLRGDERAAVDATVEWLLSRTREQDAGSLRRAAITRLGPSPGLRPVAVTHLLIDLVRLDWRLEQGAGGLVAIRPKVSSDDDARREKIRREELVAHRAQLREEAKRRFIKSMERRRLQRREVIAPIFELMRDGRPLAESLREVSAASPERRLEGLLREVEPYLQIVTPGARCEHTNLELNDIWRYFRHTWANQVVSTPGRNLAFIVRDRAADSHPVIGIGALSSAVVQLSERDAWIGWEKSSFLERARAAPKSELGGWLERVAATAYDELFVDDLIAEKLVTTSDLRRPSDEVFARLVAFANVEREKHSRNTHASEIKGAGDWEDRAKTHLFRSKRALALADILYMRLAHATVTAHGVESALADKIARRGIVRALRKAKKDKVGISMADISACGAVAPYNHLLGGKLVSMLACSPEIVEAYRDKYGAAQSEIASAMAGRPIERRPDLVFLGTTSLYGVPLNQYTRVGIPAEVLNDPHGEGVRFKRLGRSKSYGTSQFSKETVEALVQLVEHERGGTRVNSLFGEGVNPKMRKIREGLDLLGAPSERLLLHDRSRTVYGVKLAANMSQYLLGTEHEPDYLFRVSGQEATSRIAAHWAERWVAPRLDKPGLLERVERERMTHPIRHGARVDLPPADDDQLPMFGDFD